MNFFRLLILSLALTAGPALAQTGRPSIPGNPPQPGAVAAPGSNQDTVSINFPRTSIFEVLSFYESLTGKHIIRDSNLAGPELAIMVPDPVSKAEAIKLIESSLLLNGYSIVPVDDGTVKVLGPSRQPRTEGLPLYTNPANLPTSGDQVVIFYVPLQFIAPEEAARILQGVIQTNTYGSIVAVPNTNALIITDKTPVILQSLALLELIDLQPAQVVTEFITLKRANATKVVEMLDEMFGDEEKEAAPPAPASQPNGAAVPEVPGAVAPAGPVQYENRLIAGRARFLADKRTNRILVVARRESYRYVRDVITQLDSAGSFENPYVRQLNYMPAGDVFPVLADMLKDRDDETQTPTSPQGQGNQQQTGNNNNNNGFNQNNSSGSDGGSFDSPDSLSDTARQSAPQSISLGEIRLIADSSENAIIVFGPPEAKERARQILELLDRRPKQVYLAVVIGQLRVGDGLDYGVNYLIKYQNFTPIRDIENGTSSSGGAGAFLSPRLFPGVDVLPDPSSLVTPEAFSTLSGLTIFGSIAESVDVYARFLETSNRFRTLSRPVIYTTNNRKATILSGQRVPVPVSTLTTTNSGINNDNAAITSNIQYQDVVLKLEVLPLINADGEVNLVIAQTNDNIIGSDIISGNEVPRIATQKITTSVRVPNGSTVVLGGLISEDADSIQEGIPYLNRIPVVGPLLGGNKSTSKERRELIVMIQPMVVDSNLDMIRASALESDRTPLGTDGMELAAPVPERVRPPGEPLVWPTPKPKKPWFPWFQKNDKTH